MVGRVSYSPGWPHPVDNDEFELPFFFLHLLSAGTIDHQARHGF